MDLTRFFSCCALSLLRTLMASMFPLLIHTMCLGLGDNVATSNPGGYCDDVLRYPCGAYWILKREPREIVESTCLSWWWWRRELSRYLLDRGKRKMGMVADILVSMYWKWSRPSWHPSLASVVSSIILGFITTTVIVASIALSAISCSGVALSAMSFLSLHLPWGQHRWFYHPRLN